MSDLSRIDLVNPDSFLAGVPHDWFRLLRREAPAFWHEEPDGPGFWVFSRYEDLKEISRDPATFASGEGTNIPTTKPEERMFIQSLMINMDPPQHVKYRRIVQKGFTPRQVKLLEPSVRKQCAEIIEAARDRGEFDFVADVAAEFPMQVICEMMGIPQEDRRHVYELSNQLIGFDDPEFAGSREGARAAAIEMYTYAQKLAREKLRNPGDDLTSILVTADVDGEKLTEHEFNSFFLLLALAGNETTRTATTHGMHLLIHHPEQRRRLVEDRSLVPKAIEEVLRYEPPVIYFRRTATRDTTLRGVEIRAGQKVTMWYPSANRDEEVFADPDRFDILRDPNPHLSFGIGEHFCLGANLARLELTVCFEELLARMPHLELGGEPKRLRSNFINAIKEMPVRVVDGD